MEEIEKILGRKPNKTEKMIYEMVDKNKYHFIKDNNGTLRAVLNEEK